MARNDFTLMTQLSNFIFGRPMVTESDDRWYHLQKLCLERGINTTERQRELLSLTADIILQHSEQNSMIKAAQIHLILIFILALMGRLGLQMSMDELTFSDPLDLAFCSASILLVLFGQRQWQVKVPNHWCFSQRVTIPSDLFFDWLQTYVLDDREKADSLVPSKEELLNSFRNENLQGIDLSQERAAICLS
ncbi:MAG: hypothetical protein NT027_20165, partial [Proteobacteria bacterium]|nr:hypothetical protein [Pseudomonadota bacterium]